jgi:hypothetical protein
MEPGDNGAGITDRSSCPPFLAVLSADHETAELVPDRDNPPADPR